MAEDENSPRFWLRIGALVLVVAVTFAALAYISSSENQVEDWPDAYAVACEDNPKCDIDSGLRVAEFAMTLEMTEFIVGSNDSGLTTIAIKRVFEVDFENVDKWEMRLIRQTPDVPGMKVGDYLRMTESGASVVENGAPPQRGILRPVWPSWFEFQTLVLDEKRLRDVGEVAEVTQSGDITRVRLRPLSPDARGAVAAHRETEYVFHSRLEISIEKRTYEGGELVEELRAVSLKVNGERIR